MEKNEWLQIKNTKQFPMELFYEYYQENNTEQKEMTPDEFRNNFQTYVNINGHIPIKQMVEYYDKKLGITKIFDKNQQIIKEY